MIETISLQGRNRLATILLVAGLLLTGACASQKPARPPSDAALTRIHPQPGGVAVDVAGGRLWVQACSESIIHVRFAPADAPHPAPSLIVLPQPAVRIQWSLTGPDQINVKTTKLTATLNLTTGAVTFFDARGKRLLAEKDRAIEPAVVQGSPTFHVNQRWEPQPDESLYGLGENQLGLVDLKGYDLDLWQHNGTAYVPLLVSSRGYGLLWDNPSFSRFGDLRPMTAIPADCLTASDGTKGHFTATYFADAALTQPLATRSEARIDLDQRKNVNGVPVPHVSTPLDGKPYSEGGIRWEATIAAPASGDYQFQTYSNGQIQVWIDGVQRINHWRQDWLPWNELVKIHLVAGSRHQLRVDWSRQSGSVVQLLWKPPAPASATTTASATSSHGAPTSLWSQVADGIDYYFIEGNGKIDNVIAGYRQLTGVAPMMPQWAFGLWQSRQRYETAQQSLDVVAGFRQRQIPFDNIVQDWFYWPADAWGSHQFDPVRFPDPTGWIKSIHDLHAHLMISVWGKFYTGTKNFDAMKAGGFLYPENLAEHVIDWLGYPYTFFDAFSAPARALFWAQVKPALFDRGVDAWWLDASEPDLLPLPTLDGQITHMNPTALGPGSKVLNAYSIMEGKTFYPNQRAAAPNQRVFILTRSGFASQQRYAQATWSGDTTSTWTALDKQIQAGLNFSLSGVPYWTMDIGGFSVPGRFSTKTPTPANLDEWRELNTRWFEFGAFVPLLRVHGEYPYREMWQFGGEDSPAYRAMLKFDHLRYQLLPYIYSLAGDITLHGGTMMRQLAMDFPSDGTARQCRDEYLFGPSLLVSPVTTYQARTRSVYLPASADWYDFWTGKRLSGGQTIDAAAPYDQIPLHVRAGSILPAGPDLQYTGEKSADPITLVVYPGADATFTLYEDDGLTYGYERGQYATIPMRWDEAKKTLTISRRAGKFPTMLDRRTFNIVFVTPGGKGVMTPPVNYLGEKVEIGEPSPQ
jgi:alpha-D-xyloside xylohydrolase